MVYPNFHKQVKVLLAEKNSTMSALAEHLNLTRQGLYKHLQAVIPNYFVVRQIAEYLDEPIHLVVGDSEFKFRQGPTDKPFTENAKNRVLLHMKRNGLQLENITSFLKISEDDLFDELENLSHFGIPDSYKGSHIDNISYHSKSAKHLKQLWLLEQLPLALNVPCEELWFTRETDPIIETKEPKPDNSWMSLDRKSKFKTTEDLLNSFSEQINDRIGINRNIIKYFCKKYPEDELSLYLSKMYRFDGFGYHDKEYREISKIISKKD